MAKDKFKILITDDDIDLRELLVEAVRNWGFEADVARDADEALKRLRMGKYDILISDLMMPGTDGLGLLKKARELDSALLVIMITGYATIESAVKAIELGAYDYIAKPFRLDELMIVIKNACERLSLTERNRALLEELREAYAEIDDLKRALSEGGKGPSDETSGGGPGAGPARPGKEARPLKQQEYLKEADRFNNKKKTAPKATD